MVWVAGSPEVARQNADQARAWSLGPAEIRYYQAPDTVFYDPAPWDATTIHSRTSVLAALSGLGAEDDGRGRLISTSIWALMPRSVPPTAFRRALERLAPGQVISPYRLLERCVRLGYEPAVVVEEPGTFSHRGSIVDFWPPHAEQPIRVDLFGDEIDSLRAFDPADQRSKEEISEAVLVPASEALPEWGKAAAGALERLDLSACALECQQRMGEQIEHLTKGDAFAGMEFYLPFLYPRPANLLSYLPKNTLLLLDDVVDLRSAALGLEEQAQGLRAEMVAAGRLPPNYPVPYYGWGELEASLAARSAISLGLGYGEAEPVEDGRAFIAAPRYGGQMAYALSDIVELRDDAQRVVLITRQSERLTDLLREERISTYPSDEVTEPPEPGSVTVVDGIVGEGWALPSARCWCSATRRCSAGRGCAAARPPPAAGWRPSPFSPTCSRAITSYTSIMASAATWGWCARPSAGWSANTWRSSTPPPTGCSSPSNRPTGSPATWAPTTDSPTCTGWAAPSGRRCAPGPKRPSTTWRPTSWNSTPPGR